MDLLPLRAAAGGGTVDGLDSSRLVAAGFTLLQRSVPLVRALAGRRAGILLPTSPQFLIALAAGDGRGAVLLNPLSSPAEIAHQLADANVGAVFTVAALQQKLPADCLRVLLDEAPATAVVVTPGGASQIVDLGSHFGLELEGDADAPGRDEECAIVYTSAMRGTALGAILSHRNLLANARQTVAVTALTADDHALAVLPFSHLFGLTASLIAPLLAGARVTTVPRFNALSVVELLEGEGITQLVGVPAIFAGLLAAIERRGGSLKADRLRLCICGGAPLRVQLQERWAATTGVELRQGYGLTEASPVALFNRVQDPNVRGTLGLPLPGVRVSVRDSQTSEELGAGEEGEICVAGETVFRGYVGDAMGSAPRGLRVRDGWLHTGDRGLIRADGRVEFRGVYKSMFTRNGFNVYPAELERVVGAMPGVERVRVTALPDAAREHEIALEITGDATLTEATVRAWCEAQLAKYKQPARITISAG